MQPDQDPNDHDLLVPQVVNYSCDINVTVNKGNEWKRLPAGTRFSLGPFLSTSCLLIDPIYCDPEVFINSLNDDRYDWL